MLCHWLLGCPRMIKSPDLASTSGCTHPNFLVSFSPRADFIYIFFKNTSPAAFINKTHFCPRKSNPKNCVAPNKGLCSARARERVVVCVCMMRTYIYKSVFVHYAMLFVARSSSQKIPLLMCARSITFARIRLNARAAKTQTRRE